MKPRVVHGALAALLVATALAAYSHLLAPGRVLYSPHTDLMAQHLATKTVLRDAIHEGHGVPEWRDDQFAGNPAAGNPQAMYLYPFHLLFAFMDPARAVGPTFFFNALLSAAGFFWLGAALGLRREARWFMAAAGLVEYKLVAAIYAGWLSNTMVIAMLPAFLAAAIRLTRVPSARSATALAAAASLCATGGHFQYAYYISIFVTAYVAWRCAATRRSGDHDGAKKLVRPFAVSAALGLGLSAYVLLPLASDAALLSRTTTSYEFFLADHALTTRTLLSLLSPATLDGGAGARSVEFWEDAAYFGIVPLMLAVFGVVRERRNRDVVFFAAAFVLSIALAADTPFQRFLFQYAPLWSLFRAPARLLFVTSVFGIALAGFGLQSLLNLADRGSPGRFALVVGLVLTAVVGAEGAFRARGLLTTAPVDEVWPAPSVREFPDVDRSGRVLVAGRSTMNYGRFAKLALASVNGYDPYNDRRYGRYFELMTRGRAGTDGVRVWADADRVARWDLADALGVAWIVTSEPITKSLPWLAPVAELPDAQNFVFYRGMVRASRYVYRNMNAKPRAFWARRAIGADPDHPAERLVEQADLRQTAIVEGWATPAVDFDGPADRVDIIASRPGSLMLEATCARRRYLVFSEMARPGWRLTVDGAPAEWMRTDVALMGAWIEPGRHRVELEFRQPLWRAGIVLSLLSLCVTVVIAARRHR